MSTGRTRLRCEPTGGTGHHVTLLCVWGANKARGSPVLCRARHAADRSVSSQHNMKNLKIKRKVSANKPASIYSTPVNYDCVRSSELASALQLPFQNLTAVPGPQRLKVGVHWGGGRWAGTTCVPLQGLCAHAYHSDTRLHCPCAPHQATGDASQTSDQLRQPIKHSAPRPAGA